LQRRSWWWPRSLQHGARGMVLVIIKVPPKQECHGGLDDGRGPFKALLVGWFWWLLRLLPNKNVKEVSVIAEVTPKQECQGGFSEITLGLSCKGGLDNGQGHSRAGLVKTS
jgi:hypothetical protein